MEEKDLDRLARIGQDIDQKIYSCRQSRSWIDKTVIGILTLIVASHLALWIELTTLKVKVEVMDRELRSLILSERTKNEHAASFGPEQEVLGGVGLGFGDGFSSLWAATDRGQGVDRWYPYLGVGVDDYDRWRGHRTEPEKGREK